jgi:diguanylate cyclase
VLRRIDFSPTSRLRVYALTGLGTLACVALAFAVDSFSLETGTWRLEERWINNLIIPLLIAPPCFYFLLSKLRELSLAHQELFVVASTDSLTNCLNRRAFTALVEGYLAKIDSSRDKAKGALLILDVDHFKSVNDLFGHEAGDEVLQLIAATIKANVRDVDLVARLGGEEFGVFLAGSDPARTMQVAERIRSAVNGIDFRAAGTPHPLSLSIGGVSFLPPTTFSELYRSADQRLYEAKRAGRNRVMLAGAKADAVALM